MTKPEIGVSMLYCLGKPFRHMTRQLEKFGGETRLIEIVDEALHALNRRRVRALREIAGSYGFAYTVHAPFADINIAAPSKTIRGTVLKILEKSIRCASEIDAKLWVFHPGVKTGVTYFYPGLEWRLNIESTRKLLRLAEEHNIKIAIENVPEPYPFLLNSVEQFSKFYEELGEDLGFTLDVGHANLNGQIEEFLKNFQQRLVHMHVSDNHGDYDAHLGIGYGNINWKNVAETIKAVKFNGSIVVESVEHVAESVQKLRELLLR